MCTSGPGCSKLTKLLVNVSLKFQTLISTIHHYFLLKKCENCKSFSHFFIKNISVFGYKIVKHLASWPLNELIKLTMLWTTVPWKSKGWSIHQHPTPIDLQWFVLLFRNKNSPVLHHVWGSERLKQGAWKYWFRNYSSKQWRVGQINSVSAGTKFLGVTDDPLCEI